MQVTEADARRYQELSDADRGGGVPGGSQCAIGGWLVLPQLSPHRSVLLLAVYDTMYTHTLTMIGLGGPAKPSAPHCHRGIYLFQKVSGIDITMLVKMQGLYRWLMLPQLQLFTAGRRYDLKKHWWVVYESWYTPAV